MMTRVWDRVGRRGVEIRQWCPGGPKWTALLLLIILANLVIGCDSSPTPAQLADLPSPTASPTSTPTGLPTVPAVARRTATPTVSATATSSATATLTQSPTPTFTASPTFTPSTIPTQTNTPQPPGPTITPTETITPTPTATLTPTPMFSPTPLPTPGYTGDVIHILLMGLDSTQNLGSQNTDVILVAAVNKDTKQVSMLSIPRDLWVYIPTYGWSRINVAHKIGYRTNYPGGGPGLLAEVLRINLGVPIDHWVRIGFQGFAKAVDKLGGVDMVVSCPVNLRYQPPGSAEEEEMILQPGVYHMDGATALRYVRTRRGTSDFDRARRQQQFLKAVWAQTKSPDIILKIPGLWSAMKGSFQTDLELGDVLSLAPIALDLKPQRIRSRYIGPNQTVDWTTSEGWQVLLPRPDRIQQVVASLYAPPSATEDPVAGEDARIEVLNGTYRPQLGLVAADQLRWVGLNIVDTRPAENPGYPQTQIIVHREMPKAQQLLVRDLKVKPQNVLIQPDPNHPVDITVILGEDYNPCH
jgi:LCP family protein required for cell wall assembly